MSVAIQEPSKSPTSIGSPLETRDVNPKLLKVLKRLLQPKLKLHNDEYLNLLLTHLTTSQDSSNPLASQDLEPIKQLLLVWLKGAVMQFERVKDPPTAPILAFVLNVTKYLCEDEQKFVILNREDIFERLLTIVNKVSKPNVTVGLIRLISVFMDHKSGLQWVISTNHWRLLIDIILNNETIYVVKEGNTFVAKLLVKSVALNPSFCKNVIQDILIPLDHASKNMSDIAMDRNEAGWLSSTLRILNEVLTILLKDCKNQNEKSVILLFIENYNLEKRIRELISLTKNSELKADLMKFIIFLGLYDLSSKFSGLPTVQIAKTDTSMSILLNVIYDAATEVSVLCTLQLLYVTLNSWFSIKATMPTCVTTYKKILSFEDQILALQAAPILTVFVKKIGIKVYTDDYKDDCRYNFVTKLLDRIYEKTIRVKYKWMQYLLDNFSINNGILALKFLVHSKQFYNKENGILAFQMLTYLIEDLTSHLKTNPHAQVDFLNEPDYLALHLKVMDIIIDEFDVRWKDSVEALFVLNQIYSLLNGFIWPSKIVVNALKLAEKAISKYMTYQMALLIDDSENSVMNEFPPLLKVKLHDGAWEVRDSTVEVIHQFAITANNTKFASSKRLMLENDFPFGMVRMATSDGSSFVRASALKCLQEIIKNEAFWDHITSSCNIFEIILKILKMETEGIVRSEAASLVDCIYEHQKIPDELMTTFYDAMSHAVVADLHWEVRVNALKFWNRVIDEHLTQQGMIDGSFPNVTFSKQLKKIVTLSPIEVRKRLVTVLQELSEIGCLSVFYEAIQDECDLEVSKFATQTISDFIGLLKQYEVSKQTLQEFIPSSPINEPEKIDFPVLDQTTMDTMFHCPQEEISLDSVMEQILDTRDLNLLESVFNELDAPVMEHIEMKKHTVLCPTKFLDLVYSDLEGRLNEKTRVIQGIDNFQSLLDDILKEYEPTDVNSMDCY